MLSPPSAKKSSSTPAEGTSRTRAYSSHSSRSRAVSGARPVPVGAWSGTGRAAASSLPLGVTGSRSSGTKAEGTM